MEMGLAKQDLDTLPANKPAPMVAIEMITYNHEKYIAQAIESVLIQETSFPYKLIICEDGSSDNTAQICLDYKNKFPDKIDLHLNQTNSGVKINARKLHNLSFNSGAKYIAILDGDDYWLQPSKLQKQVDFLEKHPEYVLCFHKMKILEPDGKVVEDYITETPKNYESLETLAARGNYIHTPSVVYRNILGSLPPEFDEVFFGDYFMHMMLGQHGKLKLLNEQMLSLIHI